MHPLRYSESLFMKRIMLDLAMTANKILYNNLKDIEI